MTQSPEELAQRKRFEDFYLRSQSPVLLSVERAVCGCDYGGNSWTTRAEAHRIADLLELRPGLRLLDLGAGSGWPGLYMTERSGCDLVLVDLPLPGLKIAAERAEKDRLAGRCAFAVADATALPFPDGSFHAISHSDLLCCLKPKHAVFQACRRAIRADGRMAFTVIFVAPDLSPADQARALANGPEFVEAEADYPTLLENTGWTLVERQDLTSDFAATCRRTWDAEDERKDAMAALIGAAEFEERQAGWQPRISAVEDGLIRRELFLAIPKSG